MPTNLLRDRNRAVRPDKAPQRRRATKPKDRRILIAAGRVKIRAQLLDTPTADRRLAGAAAAFHRRDLGPIHPFRDAAWNQGASATPGSWQRLATSAFGSRTTG